MHDKEFVVLFEYDKPINQSFTFLNYTSGIWQWIISSGQNGIKTVLDDRGITGYYRDNNIIVYNIKSLTVDAEQYNRVYTYADLLTTNKSFLYTISDTLLLVHFDVFEPPFKFTEIVIGAVVGFSKGKIGDNKPYFNNIYYEPRVSKIFNISKKKGALFYGLLKYTTGSIACINDDGFFDDWRDGNLYAQASRILIGEKDDAYSAFTLAYQGQIENDSRSWTEFSVKLSDPRKGLTQPIATNLLNKTTYPSLNDSNVDKPKPIRYGLQNKARCICLNETASGGKHTFLLCDTEFNAVSAFTATNVWVEKTNVTATDLDLTAGTFKLATADVSDNFDSVVATFTASAITNGVDIIKDLMYRYDDKNYTSTFWDTTETAIAQAISRDTSLSIEDDKKLQEVIEKVCVDIDGLFFFKDTGVYTVRIYDANRAVTKIIYQDEWVSEPSIENNGNEFLSSVIIKYNKNQQNNTHDQYENVDYKAEVFDTYKTYKTTTIETNLTTLSDAQAKSESIMSISKLVGDIITRSIPYCTDIEIMDFIAASPITRLSEASDYNVYEVIGITKNFDKFEIALTMRYVEPYTLPIDQTYSVLVDESGNFATDESGNTNVIRG